MCLLPICAGEVRAHQLSRSSKAPHPPRNNQPFLELSGRVRILLTPILLMVDPDQQARFAGMARHAPRNDCANLPAFVETAFQQTRLFAEFLSRPPRGITFLAGRHLTGKARKHTILPAHVPILASDIASDRRLFAPAFATQAA